MFSPFHQHPGSSPLPQEDLQESNRLPPSGLPGMSPHLLQLPQPPMCGTDSGNQDAGSWLMADYSMNGHFSEGGYSADTVGGFDGLSLSNIPELFYFQPPPTLVPNTAPQYQTLPSLGFDAFSIPHRSPGWYPTNSQLPAPPPFGPDFPPVPEHSQLGSNLTFATPDNQAHLHSRNHSGELSPTPVAPRSQGRLPPHPRSSPYSQPAPQFEKRALPAHHTPNYPNSISHSKDNAYHPHSPQPPISDIAVKPSARPYESFTSSFPLQPHPGSSSSPLPLEAHLFEFSAQPSPSQRPLSSKALSSSRIARTHSNPNRPSRHSATFTIDCGFNSSILTHKGLVPLPEGVNAEMKTKRRVDFTLDSSPGIKLTEALRENFALDRADEAVLTSESDRQIHLCVTWPGYEQEGGYIPLRDKLDNQRISRRLFAHRVANLVAQRLVKFSKSQSSRPDGKWVLPKGKIAYENVYILHVAHVSTLQRYVVQLEVRA